MKSHGFTLIEFLIVIAILMILGVIAGGAFLGATNKSSDISYGINGVVETRCIDGYKFVITNGNGRYGGSGVTQVLDAERRPVPCGENKQPGAVE